MSVVDQGRVVSILGKEIPKPCLKLVRPELPHIIGRPGAQAVKKVERILSFNVLFDCVYRSVDPGEVARMLLGQRELLRETDEVDGVAVVPKAP
jgi:hypothetical protein